MNLDDYSNLINIRIKHEKEFISKNYKIVSYNQAIKLWKNGISIYCYVPHHRFTYFFKATEQSLKDYFFDANISSDMIKYGTWFINA